MKGSLVLLFIVLLLIFFGLPLINGSITIPSAEPHALGQFIGGALDYWKIVFSSIFG
ncbi:MAG: hypothetical protein ACE5LQ_07955 [Candidatus Bipolaricaulia bacterium]